MKSGPISNSKLSHTILKLNPGISRNLEANLTLSKKLVHRDARSAEYNRKVFLTKFAQRREKREKLYNTLKSRLDSSARSNINTYREELRMKDELKLDINNGGSKISVNKSDHDGTSPDSQTSVPHQEDSSHDWQDLSRRSSLKSSILDVAPSRSESPGPVHTEDPFSGIQKKPALGKPEVVVTKSKNVDSKSNEDKSNQSLPRTMALLSLLPAPTPTRFVGKMHMKMEEGRIQRKSSAGSRRSSIAPTTETIVEEQPGQDSGSGKSSPRKKSTGAISSRIAGRLKMNSPRRQPKELAAQGTESSDTSSRISSPRGSRSSIPSPTPSVSSSLVGSWMKSRKSSVSSVSSIPSAIAKGKKGEDKRGMSGSTLKARAGFLKKKKKEDDHSEVQSPRQIRQRLFFVERTELTDEEIIQKIGGEEISKEMSTNLDEVVSTTALINKLVKPSSDKDVRKKSSGSGFSGLQFRNLVVAKSRMTGRSQVASSADDEGNGDQEFGHVWYRGLPTSTRFLGKLISKRDHHGLLVGTPPPDQEPLQRSNPVFLALEKIKLKPQSSTDSSTAESRVSPGIVSDTREEGDDERLDRDDIVKGLQSGLCRVRQPTILEWNLHKHVRGDRELKPIFIAF